MTENTVELSQKFNDVKISCGDAKMTKSSKPKGPSATKAKENSFKKMSKVGVMYVVLCIHLLLSDLCVEHWGPDSRLDFCMYIATGVLCRS